MNQIIYNVVECFKNNVDMKIDYDVYQDLDKLVKCFEILETKKINIYVFARYAKSCKDYNSYCPSNQDTITEEEYKLLRLFFRFVGKERLFK